MEEKTYIQYTEEKTYVQHTDSTETSLPNQIDNYPTSESTIASAQRNNYGYQDTYGESEANQVSVEGIFFFYKSQKKLLRLLFIHTSD